MRYSNELLNKKFEVLPKNIKEMMGSLKTAEIIQIITDKHQLHIDKAGILGDEITYVMVGAEKATDFIRNLKVQLKLPDEQANAIAKDVNEKLFLPMRESLKETADSSVDEPKVQQEIHHPQLDQKPEEKPDLEVKPQIEQKQEKPINIIDKEEESKEIKNQIIKQQAIHQTAPPPVNLPTAESLGSQEQETPQIQDTNKKTQPSDSVKVNEEQDSIDITKKKPFSADPYREPID